MQLTNSILFSPSPILSFFFFFNDTATTEIYTLSLHDALPISLRRPCTIALLPSCAKSSAASRSIHSRSEEHTSELQSRLHLVCRLLLEKKKERVKVFDTTLRDGEQSPGCSMNLEDKVTLARKL